MEKIELTYFDQIEQEALSQQALAIFDQKREKDIISTRLAIMDELDIMKPEV